jgi:hypothetical protein
MGDVMPEDPLERELDLELADELAMVESSRPEDPIVDSAAGWQLDLPEAEAYEARLLSLRGALEAVEGTDG